MTMAMITVTISVVIIRKWERACSNARFFALESRMCVRGCELASNAEYGSTTQENFKLPSTSILQNIAKERR